MKTRTRYVVGWALASLIFFLFTAGCDMAARKDERAPMRDAAMKKNGGEDGGPDRYSPIFLPDDSDEEEEAASYPAPEPVDDDFTAGAPAMTMEPEPEPEERMATAPAAPKAAAGSPRKAARRAKEAARRKAARAVGAGVSGAMSGSDPLADMDLPDAAPDSVDPIAEIDRILENMQIAQIAFNTPERMNIESVELIHLALDMKKSIKTLKDMVEGAGKRVGASIRVSSRMQARLSGRNFKITAITPETQAISGRESTDWKWEIQPEKEGRHSLHLTLAAMITVEGQSASRTIRTFDRVIEIQVTAGQKIQAFLKQNWQWLWAAVLVPLVTFLWRRRKKKVA
ncbi:conserved hypothetical protein [Candidatus Desulfarcum epimagneticum]|uniref:Uncharacterized protein n=1 Tax=uncultured Desulfobacteraceae bacterium TaxID=218296 RepID=A0A484HDY9_9BACT|nr:conserved hypothetical protein [uncultured Desulfobacteraceae bacterium]